MLTSKLYKMPLPDPRDINQEMLNAMPEEIMARLLFKYNSGATHVLFETQTANDGLNLLVTAVAKLSENATTLNLPQAFGYKNRGLTKYRQAYEAKMRAKLTEINQIDS